MFFRFRDFLLTRSFFLFGARGTGKSTLLGLRFDQQRSFWLNLLDSKVEERFAHDPTELYRVVKALPPTISHVIVDEIQKVPKLLDEVHRLIEETDKIFVLTGSSSRKLKYGGANLLAGRAFVYNLYPLSSFEIKEAFRLDDALKHGTLPAIFHFQADSEKEAFLRAYATTYLQEEIWAEQVIRKLAPFRRFLEVAAQSNGKIINYANIARDVGVDDKTVKEYFCILEDTLVGFFLEPYHNSFRKRLVEKPKFYFFDPGVVRALSRRLSVPLIPSTAAYGEAFEHFVILEIQRLAHYFQPDYRFSFLRTASDVEIDLIIERPGQSTVCIEIKSSEVVREKELSSFIRLTQDMAHEGQPIEAWALSRDPFVKRLDHVTCYPWQQGLQMLFPEIL